MLGIAIGFGLAFAIARVFSWHYVARCDAGLRIRCSRRTVAKRGWASTMRPATYSLTRGRATGARRFKGYWLLAERALAMAMAKTNALMRRVRHADCVNDEGDSDNNGDARCWIMMMTWGMLQTPDARRRG